jgi:hypothetical protein
MASSEDLQFYDVKMRINCTIRASPAQLYP